MPILQEAERAPKPRRPERSGEVPEMEPRFLGRCHYSNESGGPCAGEVHRVVSWFFLSSPTNVESIPKLQGSSPLLNFEIKWINASNLHSPKQDIGPLQSWMKFSLLLLLPLIEQDHEVKCSPRTLKVNICEICSASIVRAKPRRF
jgi:hypothetical protein